MKTFKQYRNGSLWLYFNWEGDKLIRVYNASDEHLDTITIYGYEALLNFRQTGESFPEEYVKERIAEWVGEERRNEERRRFSAR